MLFWLVGTALAATVAAALAAALIRGGGTLSADSRREIEFYKSQLAAIEAEKRRSQLSGSEAEQSRREVSRRLLRAHERTVNARPAGPAPRLPTAIACAATIALLIPGAFAIHQRTGSPGMSDMPLKKRLDSAESARASRPSQAEAAGDRGDWLPGDSHDPELVQLVQDLREKLSGAAPDPEGLRILARGELSLGNTRGAIRVQERLIAALGSRASASDFSRLAALLVSEAGGYVSPEAETAVLQALALNEADATARYNLGLMFGQTGRPDLAVSIWSRLMKDLPEDSPISADLRRRLPAAAATAGMTVALPPPRARAPVDEAVAAAESMNEAERAEFISGMVSGLRQRLNEEGGTAAEWSLLIHSLMVLGDTDAALRSFERATQIFADSPQDLRSIADSAGIGISD